MKDLREAENHLSQMKTDPLAWLRQAKHLKTSADVILVAWESAIKKPIHLMTTQHEMLSFSKSYMLLTAFAFENLFKGILNGRNSSNTTVTASGGHGIVQMAKEITALAPDEIDLFERLQIYLIWAGRYQIPNRPQTFLDESNNVKIRKDDPPRIDRLFEHFNVILDTEHSDRERMKV